MRPKVGHIEFLNCLPLYYGLVKGDMILDLDLVKGSPTELNDLLLKDKLDISPVSSIEYARNSGSLILFPDFTVSSDDKVRSIILLSKVPLEELAGRTVALSSTSATSQVLTKIVLKMGYDIEPDYLVVPPVVTDMFASADAALLIGDIALRYYVERQGFFVYDLGAEWKKLTGKRMVYAVWAARRGFAVEHPELLTHVFMLFRRSMEYSKQHIGEICDHAVKWEPFSRFILDEYFRGLRFDFGPDAREGLRTYYELACKIGALDEIPSLHFIDDVLEATG
jgi:chorismate dehydratase